MSESTTLINGVLPGAGYIHLDRPVSVPCIITLSPDTPFAERAPLYKCTDDGGPFIAWLGVDNPHGRPLTMQLERAHSAGGYVRVETAVADPEESEEAAQETQDLKAEINAYLDEDIEDLEPALRYRDHAIRAAIEFHEPEGPDGEQWCVRCEDNWPCEELSAIADALEIEDEDARGDSDRGQGDAGGAR